MKRIEELKGIMDDARRELAALRAEEYKAEVQAWKGRYFKYRNSYSMPETPSDYWFIYGFTMENGDGGIDMLGVEIDKNDKVEIEIRPEIVPLNDGWHEIDRAEFLKALKRVRVKIDALLSWGELGRGP